MRRWRRRALPDEPTTAELVDAMVDADLEAVKHERLPEVERHATAWRLLEPAARDDSRYIRSFETGYLWGEQAQMLLVGPAAVHDEVIQTAGRYDELRKAGWAGALEDPAAGAPLHVAEVLAPGLMASRAGKFVTNADTNPYGSGEEAFRAYLEELTAIGQFDDPVDESLMESVFNAGAVFYALETQLLLALRRQARVDRVRRS
jgi:hypothetical protein